MHRRNRRGTAATGTASTATGTASTATGTTAARRRPPATPQQAAGTVPTAQHVLPGASVVVVVKADQPTGRETAGVVAELLTRGNHPRGIKVRLRDGQVGRVQRMADAPPPAAAAAAAAAGRLTHRYTDVRTELDEFPEAPPPRGLADFMPAAPDSRAPCAAPGIQCPVCEAFEGDEAAVTHHIQREHFGEPD